MDSRLRLWAIWLTGGEGSDHACAPYLAKQVVACGAHTLVADRGYDSNALRPQVAADGMKVIIPPMPNRVEPLKYDKAIYRRRNAVERFIARIKEFRRVATRYDKLAAHYLGFVLIAAITTNLKAIC